DEYASHCERQQSLTLASQRLSPYALKHRRATCDPLHEFQTGFPVALTSSLKPNALMLCIRRQLPGRLQSRQATQRRPLRVAWRSLPRVAPPQRDGNQAPAVAKRADGPSTDLRVILERLVQLGLPYWQTEPSARWKLAGVVGLTLSTTVVSVIFNFLGRDFFTALSEKDEAAFHWQLAKYLGGFAAGIPVFVFRGYFQSKLSLEWRQWLTQSLLSDYLSRRAFYSLQQGGEVDNPDQRIAADVATFTDTALSLSLTALNALIDLVSFSGILFAIYPPLFGALLAYALGGTAASVALGKNLVTLNFQQEAREADLRYGLVRVRENAESIAFYGGEEQERELLKQRLQAAVTNYLGLLVASRNLDFFTSFYRYLIQLLPAAVVAPLFFQGKIDFGVINQSQSAFNHILNDVSLVIYQIESLAGFSAVVDRLGEFNEAISARRGLQDRQEAAAAEEEEEREREKEAAVLETVIEVEATEVVAAAAAGDSSNGSSSSSNSGSSGSGGSVAAAGEGQLGGQQQQQQEEAAPPLPGIRLRFLSEEQQAEQHQQHLQQRQQHPQQQQRHAAGGSSAAPAAQPPLLHIRGLTLVTPRGGDVLLRGLDLQVPRGSSLLIMGPSGAGKTSLLRAVAGLWSEGGGRVAVGAGRAQVVFLPQRPYMVLGSLREQALYPRRYGEACNGDTTPADSNGSSSAPTSGTTTTAATSNSSGDGNGASSISSNGDSNPVATPAASSSSSSRPLPSDEEVLRVLRLVQLGHLLARYAHKPPAAAPPSTSSGTDTNSSNSNSTGNSNAPDHHHHPDHNSSLSALDAVADWASTLSLGEQQRLGWARLLLARPQLALLDEATSALDQDTEAKLYRALQQSGITYVSVGHRSSLREYHTTLLLLRNEGGSSSGGEGSSGATWEVRQLAAGDGAAASSAAAAAAAAGGVGQQR
ncbi:hypothetical protein Agub_g3347, partial [Astrephomene gubernaculifera]